MVRWDNDYSYQQSLASHCSLVTQPRQNYHNTIIQGYRTLSFHYPLSYGDSGMNNLAKFPAGRNTGWQCTTWLWNLSPLWKSPDKPMQHPLSWIPVPDNYPSEFFHDYTLSTLRVRDVSANAVKHAHWVHRISSCEISQQSAVSPGHFSNLSAASIESCKRKKVGWCRPYTLANQR